MKKINPWDRQPFDTDETFKWFQAYRDTIPPRRLSRVRVSVPGAVVPSLQTLLDWYNEGHWNDRAKAWDEHLDELRQEETEAIVQQDAREKAARRLAMANDLQELSEIEVAKIVENARDVDAPTLKPTEVLKFADAAIKLGRLLDGESTENVSAKFDFSNMPVADAKKLLAQLQQAKKK